MCTDSHKHTGREGEREIDTRHHCTALYRRHHPTISSEEQEMALQMR